MTASGSSARTEASSSWSERNDPHPRGGQPDRDGDFDEIIVSTLPRKVSKWLRRDLIRRIEGLGLPVTTVVPREANRTSTLEAMASQPGSGGFLG
jgi:hypothetical protein